MGGSWNSFDRNVVDHDMSCDRDHDMTPKVGCLARDCEI